MKSLWDDDEELVQFYIEFNDGVAVDIRNEITESLFNCLMADVVELDFAEGMLLVLFKACLIDEGEHERLLDLFRAYASKEED